jgi:ethanolamine ammonia-lyase small subunit
VRSRAAERSTYLRRPDLGRRLDEASVARLSGELRSGFDLAFVAADGLSPTAVQRHVAPLLQAVRLRLPEHCSAAPVVIAEQARVALGDEIGALLNATVIIVLIGERPGLSSPDSL